MLLPASKADAYPDRIRPLIRPVQGLRKKCLSVRSANVLSRPLHLKALPKPDALYLFFCALLWHKGGDTAAGWELVQAMQSGDRGARALAAELLAETENGRLRVRDLRRTRRGLHQIMVATDGHLRFVQQRGGEAPQMNTPYGLQMVENCNTCRLKKSGWFCALSTGAVHGFSEFSHLTTYPGNAILFVEGQMPRGTFVLCSGKVKLSTASREGKVLVFRMVEPGEVIGLGAM